MSPAKLHHDTIDEAIASSKHAIINKFILASLTFGVLASGVGLWRNVSLGVPKSFAWSVILSMVILWLAWICRHRITFQVKAAILFATYLLVGVNGIIHFGPFSNSIVFFNFCCLILVLSSKRKWIIIVGLVISLIIPLRASLHFAGVFVIENDFNLMLWSVPVWISYFCVFLLTAYIIFLGVGQLRDELNANFDMLRNSVTDLAATNAQLRNEIKLKEIFEENLAISSQKFKTLFEGSRDCVILLNSSAEIVEANPATCYLSGYTLEELRSANIFELVDLSYRSAMRENFALHIAGSRQPVLTEIIIISREGKSIPVEFNSNLILTEDEVMMMSTIRDISYRKQLENEKINAVLAAEEIERERFSKDLHDDLGPVFSTLNLYLQTLSKKEADRGKKEILDNLSFNG